jgi:hypothetical protein
MNHNDMNNPLHNHDSKRTKKPKIEEINKVLDTEGKYHISENHGNKLESIRRDEHKGNKIVIITKYDIEVDGKKIFPPMHVSNNGSVGTHTLPNYASNSALELVKTLINCFPEDFKEGK